MVIRKRHQEIDDTPFRTNPNVQAITTSAVTTSAVTTSAGTTSAGTTSCDDYPEVCPSVESTVADEIQPKTLKLKSYYRDSLPFFPDGLTLFASAALIAIGVGIHFASFALIPLSFEGVFWSSFLFTVLLCGLFYISRVTNFPLLFVVSMASALLALTIAHLYTFLIFRSIFLTTTEGLHAGFVHYAVGYFFKKPAAHGIVLENRPILDWVLIVLQSAILGIVGALPPFSVFIMHDVDDRE